jgi:HEAT repeat protein
MNPPIIVAHAPGEELDAETLAVPLRNAGYRVVHLGTSLVGESSVEEANTTLAHEGPVVVCGTIKAAGTGWAHRLVNAARISNRVLIFVVQMDKEAYVQPFAMGETITEYWRSPERAISDLLIALAKYYPLDASEVSPGIAEDAEKRYRELVLEACDIIDLANLGDTDRHLATRQLELRRLYVPLRIDVEISSSDEATAASVESIEQRRHARRTFANQGSSGATSEVIEEKKNRVPFGVRLGEVRRLVVLGDPGAGKSTLIRWLATAYLLRLKKDSDWRALPDVATLPERDWLPIVIRCRDLAHDCLCGTLDDILHHTLRKSEMIDAQAGLLRNRLREKLEKGEALLLIDGLDEIVDPTLRARFCQQLEQISIALPNASIVVTSRIVGYKEIGHRIGRGFEHVTVSELSREDKDDFARLWCSITEPPERRELSAMELIADIHSADRIERLTGNPMLLTTMALVKRSIGRLPNRRSDLYANALLVLLNWRSDVGERLDDREAIPQLEYVAFAMCDQSVQQLTQSEIIDLLGRIRDDFPNIHALQNHPPEEFLRLLERRTGILVEAGHRRELGMVVPVYEFRHLTFQEYLAARALVDGRFPNRDKSRSLAQNLAPLAGRTVEGRTPDARDVEVAVTENWREAIRLCVASYDRDDVDEVLRAVLFPLKGEEASTSGRPRAVLASLCLVDDPNVSEAQAIQVLSELIRYVEERDGYRHTPTTLHNAVADLGTSRWGAVAARLLAKQFISQKEPLKHTLGVLCGLVASQSVPTDPALIMVWFNQCLSQLTTVNDEEVVVAALSIAELAFKEVDIPFAQCSETLLELVERNDAVSPAAAQALYWMNHESLGSNTWHPSLYHVAAMIAMLEKRLASDGVLASLCRILGRERVVDSVVPIVNVLNSESSRVRIAAATALGEIQDPHAVEPLLSMLSDESIEVRRAATFALGQIKDERALHSLIAQLRDESPQARLFATMALGQFGDQVIIEPLLQRLHDDSSQVRLFAVFALAEFQDDRVVEALLLQLKDHSSDVRAAAAGALGSVENARVVDHLINLFQDDSADARRAAAMALGQQGDERAMKALLDNLNDRNVEVQSACATAIGSIARRHFQNDNLNSAISIFSELSHRKGDADILNNLGYCLIVAKRYEEAMSVFASVSTANSISTSILIHHNLGVLSCLMGRDDEAETHLRAALRLVEATRDSYDPKQVFCMMLLDGNGDVTTEYDLPSDAAILLNLYRVGALSFDNAAQSLAQIYPSRQHELLAKVTRSVTNNHLN